MPHLVHVEQKEVIFKFELGQKCKSLLHIRNLMHTMPVAFKLQTTSPHKFRVRPPNGYVQPLSELTIDIILKPQQELPPSFPFSTEKFVLKTALAHNTNGNSSLPEGLPDAWFSSPQTRVFIDAKLKVIYIGASLLRHCVAREDEHALREIFQRHTGPSIADEDSRTALHTAASIGNCKLVNLLLESGVEINAADANGRMSQWEAVCRGQVNVVEELLKSGAHIEANEALKKGFAAPIHEAATSTSTELLEQLIGSGADLETEDQEGQTEVHFDIESGRLKNLKVLQAEANKSAQRGDGRTPLLIADENSSLEGSCCCY
ncbi:hypothetical protein GOP47_0007572 [Adiantum capillus-veneris]|uniref:MSP domain-containing protein n=1 Tax=Adiantum capillus-veneris TaxID=13818 RepID=A0A9D4V1U5_ADICA|nr:hypothetical protein GOP47_0007572 [Adiantum capillus-veneris]